MSAEAKARIIKLIENGNLEGALKKLSELDSIVSQEFAIQLSQIKSRFSELRRQRMSGIVAPEDHVLEMNKITNSIIEFVETAFTNDVSNKGEDELEVLVGCIDNLIKRVQLFIEDLKMRPYADLFSEDENELFQTSLGKWDNQTFRVSILALMKSGKSTLLNALIGGEYLPSGTLAETMSLVKIKHRPYLRSGKLYIDGKKVAEGPGEIRKMLREENRKAREMGANNDGIENSLEVRISSLKGKSVKDCGFEILDTPGVNEEGLGALAKKIERIVKTSDVILYLLDFTKLKSKDEAEMFALLEKWRGSLLKEVSERMFFIINKVDATNRHDREKNMGKDAIIEYVQDVLKKNLPEISIYPSQIISISAEQALLGRQVISGNATHEQLFDFKKKVFGEYHMKNAQDAECMEMAKRYVKDSSIEPLENQIVKGIYDKRKKILLGSVVDDLDRLVSGLSNNLSLAEAASKADIQQIKNLKKNIDEIKRGMEDVFKTIASLKKKVLGTISESFERFKEQLSQEVTLVFSADVRQRNSSRLLGYLPHFFNSRQEFTLKWESEEDLVDNLYEIHTQIHHFIDGKYSEQWNALLDLLFEEFRVLGDKLLAMIQPMVRKIEQTLNETFEIQLRPIHVAPINIDRENFYFNFEQRISKIVNSKTEFEPRVEWHQNGLSILGLQLISPDTISIPSVKFKKQYYTASSKKYEEFLLLELGKIASGSISYAQETIDTHIEILRDQSINTLERYSSRYVEIVENQIDQKDKGELSVEARLKLLRDDARLVSNIADEIQKTTKTFADFVKN